jgi:hypothetical protein
MFGDSDARHEQLEHVDPLDPLDGRDQNAAADDEGAKSGSHTREADHPVPPVTGDEAVDEAMMQLARSQAGSFAERIESGEHAHRSLQSRLGGLGGA